MKEEILHIKSISQLHELNGFEKPTHPLISIVDVSKWEINKEHVGEKMVSSLYSIALKDKSCGLEYGRNSYDFNEGTLIFIAPNQVVSVKKEQKINQIQGWMLFFHPDLIRNTSLGQKIDSYNFFSYDVYEALHLSHLEEQTITECIHLIKNEINERIDNHSQTLISSTLELLLNFSVRFYERQFNTRTALNSDIITRFHAILKKYYEDGEFTKKGIPAIEYFAEKIHLSNNYLSDTLKKETGYSAKEHINNFIIDKAKTELLNSTDSISGLAYSLGFNYPHYFSRLFKTKTGMTPLEYRQLN